MGSATGMRGEYGCFRGSQGRTRARTLNRTRALRVRDCLGDESDKAAVSPPVPARGMDALHPAAHAAGYWNIEGGEKIRRGVGGTTSQEESKEGGFSLNPLKAIVRLR